ncbi:hypothetical protein [Actinomadura litoris]|uniref:hypothetical protein n=1 Tax=Actinomadura litoris TaxID=2678616 RepID=UPI001FA70098|nr:hypothetical protein [Actinomadura litoris]
MRFHIETPLAGYTGTVGAVTFVNGRARVDDTQKAELAYFRRHHYKITPVGDQAEDEPSGDPAPGAPGGEDQDDGGEQPEPDDQATPGTDDRAEAAGDGPQDPDSPSPTGATTATTPAAPGSAGDGAGEQLRKPAKAAPVAAWTAYAKQLGITDDELGGKTKNELVDLVDHHEKKEPRR